MRLRRLEMKCGRLLYSWSRPKRRLARCAASLQPDCTRRCQPFFPQQVRKTYSGKVGGEQDDACIALQLAVTGLRCFYTSERYARFRKTNQIVPP